MRSRNFNLDGLYRSCDGSKELVQFILEKLIVSTPILLEEMELHLRNNDSASLKEVMSKLKSYFLSIQANSLVKKLEDIEVVSEQNSSKNAEHVIKSIQRELKIIIEELKMKKLR
ncbi:MAG: hypothetical protein NXI10_08080 [bacterium]|nr:hypothetical protein [bacterium]